MGETPSYSPTSLEDIYAKLAASFDPLNPSGQGLLQFSNPFLTDFWNKGVLSDSLTLLAGEPGLGKSTFALQIIRDLIKGTPDLDALYISAEESLYQLAARAQRLDIPAQIQVLNANNLENIIEVVAQKIHGKQAKNESRNLVLIIDSIQTIFSNSATGSPGSVSQVTYIVNQFLNLTKTAGIAVILIGHVTKTGDIAGPKTLEHMVDTVLLIDQPQNSSKYRTLSFTKHRFGSTDKLLFLEMAENGLTIVKNPSLLLLENIEVGIGIAYSLALDRELPLLVEIQALVHNSGNPFGSREANGTNKTKLNILVAILEKYLQLDLKSHDIYIQILGLPRGLSDDSLDLAIILAILSSLRNQPVDELFEPQFSDLKNDLKHSSKTKTEKTKLRSVFCGRLTLSGKVRTATNFKTRISAAKKLGFDYNTGISDLKDITDLKKFLIRY